MLVRPFVCGCERVFLFSRSPRRVIYVACPDECLTARIAWQNTPPAHNRLAVNVSCAHLFPSSPPPCSPPPESGECFLFRLLALVVNNFHIHLQLRTNRYQFTCLISYLKLYICDIAGASVIRLTLNLFVKAFVLWVASL